MPRYKHTQIGYVTGGAAAAALPLIYYAFRAEHDALGGYGWAMLGGVAGLGVLFSTLTVVVDEEELRFYFGPGFWTRRIPLDAIEAAEPVRNSVWHGWGIRYTTRGWLYNVSGLDAVELTVRGEGRLRVGTDEPGRLARTLREAEPTAPSPPA